ncbi:MAG TPA: hypothetical protein PK325_13685 [Cyclobacteriaceae bacterium]|nr:hypothetical protein [Cyclobacteriaceae bacterium]HMV10690.1 hypothetical protein [Cyclobacteriaceae bacterium]HMV91549.1 hypothetical protein [Cyclobacteriaceae bacterium]HMX00071.1 hypothetical protein [Cyclobacteriaceae bacterium]HMX49067.1 hypothetical protein [Cyclobacteriaceae bacterium]
MKRLLITAVLLASLQGAFAQNLLDSLKGHWTITKITPNAKNVKPGSLYFSDDGKFVSVGEPVGSLHALFRTNETTSTVLIENADKSVEEWKAAIKNGVLTMTSTNPQRKKEPGVTIMAVRKRQ